jgi:predicted AlkP superfamily phosphohydrolase/phosphomutase
VNRQKIVMIGVDAAELSLIQAHRATLPNFDRVLSRGVLQRLESVGGILPGAVWPTFYSGTPPGEHGLYHHLQWDPKTMRLRRVSNAWLHVEPFWCELERRGLSVAVVDMQMALSSHLRTGTEILNWGNHDYVGSFSARPPHLAGEVLRRFGRHPMGDEIPLHKSQTELERIRKNLVTGARQKGRLSRWLLGLQDWDFFLTIFGETHRGGHVLWPLDPEAQRGSFRPLLDVYQAVDEGIGEVLNAIPDDRTVIVFALHGMGSNTSQEHFVPAVMDRANELFAAMDTGSTASRLSGRQPGAAGRFSRSSPRQRSLMRRLRETVPPTLQHAIARAVPVHVRDAVVDRQITGGRIWELTPGLALLADLNGYVRFNLRGRELRGILDPGDESVARYVGWIRECFLSLRTAETGEPLVRDVLLSRDQFPGKRSDYLPDAIVTWSGASPASCIQSATLGTITAKLATGRGGNHRAGGFCFRLEPGATRGGQAPAGHILDLAQFVLTRLLGERAQQA